MILFKTFFVQSILDGIKVSTRRIGKKRWNKESIHQAKTSYTTRPFAYLKIISEPVQISLNKMTAQDASEEGGFTVHNCLNKTVDKLYIRTFCDYCDHFETCYQKIYVKCNGTWRPTDTPWVVRFKKIEPQSKIKFHNVTEI